jgi:hypothetical protein
MARYVIFFAAAIAAYAQGTTPKPTAEEYPVHAAAGRDQLGAEYMVHSFSSGEQMFIAENYLVVEVALIPPKGDQVHVETTRFSLRVNGKKPLQPENPAAVVASLKHRDWQLPRGPQGGIGIPGIGVGFPRQQGGPFPGGNDPNNPNGNGRLPAPPRAPDGDSNTPKKEPVNAEDILMKTALPEGTYKGAVSGFIYFPWRGKASSIKSIDLLYDDVTLKLR